MPAPDPRIHADLAHLAGLEGRARGFDFLPRQPVGSALSGRRAARVRGRGLEFLEIRGYLPGDDVRAIDWKVTARTGAPHVRVTQEERDRPALILLDQRQAMFFGTVHAMKSSTAAEIAALAATQGFDALRAPVLRITGPDAPSAASWALEQAAVPKTDAIVSAAQELMARDQAPLGSNLHIA